MQEIALKNGVEILPGLICRLLDEKDLPKVNELIASSYSYQHPGRQTFKVTKEEIGDYDVRAAKQGVKHNASLGTFVKETGELIQVEINTIHDVKQGNAHFMDPGVGRNSLELRSRKVILGDVFSDLNTRRYMHVGMGCVKPAFRARGIMNFIEDLRVEAAKLRSCEYLIGVALSFYSQKAMKRVGYRVLRDVKYADYIDPQTGLKPDLQLSPIHTSCQLLYKKTTNESEGNLLLKHKL